MIIPLGTKVRVRGKKPKLETAALRRAYYKELARNPDKPTHVGEVGYVMAHSTEEDPWPIGQLPGDPFHIVQFSKKEKDGYWAEELEVID